MQRLVFDFPDPGSGPRPPRAVFTDPVEVVAATRLDEVRPALQRVQEAAGGGLHAAGYVSYEAAPAFEPAMAVRGGARLPLVWFGLFEAPELIGEDRGEVSGQAPTGEHRVPPGPGPAHGRGDASGRGSGGGPAPDWRLEWTPEEHAAAVREVREAIAAGRTYQVNLTTRVRAEMCGDPWALYQGMRRSQGPGYHAFLDLGPHVILSASPELFFRVAGRAIAMRPMKGTRPRGRWPEEDRALEAALLSSEKDRAENLMIVDLLRNDLGRICETGSIRVTELQQIERYRTVLQMTSGIRGRLRPGVGLPEQLGALFPCGSVTGAPKISTMGEIARLERSPREVYCGAIGWVRPGGDSTFSVAIRTAWLDRASGGIEYGTGGGVVWDSTAEGEYDELRAKAVVVRQPWPSFELVETLALRDGTFTRRERHTSRMRASAAHFGLPFPGDAVEAALDDLAVRHPRGALIARLTLSENGEVGSATRPLDEPPIDDRPRSLEAPPHPEARPLDGGADPTPLIVRSARAVDSRSPWLFHKTSRRDVYDHALAAAPPGVFDVLLHNEQGEVTEFTRGNLVAEIDGERVTPARASGLLAGCIRDELLVKGVVVERVIRTEELRRATRLWFINSARGWIEVALGGQGRDPGRLGEELLSEGKNVDGEKDGAARRRR